MGLERAFWTLFTSTNCELNRQVAGPGLGLQVPLCAGRRPCSWGSIFSIYALVVSSEAYRRTLGPPAAVAAGQP